MKLDIFDKKGNIEKTYEKDVHDLLFGTVDDVSQALDLQNNEKISLEDLTTIVTEFIGSDIDTAKEIIKGIFDGLTDEELRRAKLADYMGVIVEVVSFTMGALGKVKGSDEKN